MLVLWAVAVRPMPGLSIGRGWCRVVALWVGSSHLLPGLSIGGLTWGVRLNLVSEVLWLGLVLGGILCILPWAPVLRSLM